jgi:hypothetical protein
MSPLSIFQQTERQRVSDGAIVPILQPNYAQTLVLVWPQLGDFDTLEYAWWIKRSRHWLTEQKIQVRAVTIGDRTAGQKFCAYTEFPETDLFLDPKAKLHQQLDLYPGLQAKLPGFSSAQNGWLNLLLMCAGIGSPGTLKEVFRGYLGDRNAPQLIEEDTTIKSGPLPALTGASFNVVGKDYQRPFELATLRLQNMSEVLGNWKTYVPDATYLTQRGATFWFDQSGELKYEHRDRNILGFAKNMSNPLEFLRQPSDCSTS